MQSSTSNFSSCTMMDRMSANIFKLVSLNVKVINNFQKWRIIFSLCHRKNADFMFLQERH